MTLKQSTLELLSGYGRRHVTNITRDLVDGGLLVRMDVPGITPTYRIEDGNPSAQDDGNSDTHPEYTQDDVFLLQIHHAEVMDQEAPQVPADGRLLGRVLDALERFGFEGCRGAHHGHLEQCSSWEGGKRFATFSCCYPKRGQESLEVQWFHEQVQRGLPLLRRQERDSKHEEEAPECRQPTDADLTRGRMHARKIINQLTKRKDRSGIDSRGPGSSGTGTGGSSPGAAPSAKDGPVALRDAVTAGLGSRTNEKEDS